jgi:hypothetical protein
MLQIQSIIFCLNCLSSGCEKRLVTLNVEASDNELVSIHFFYPIGAHNLFGENWQFSINSYEVNVSHLTDTVSRSIDGPDMTSWKPIANLCLTCYFKTCLSWLKNPLKWLAEEMIQLLKAPNFISYVLLELSTLWRWKKTCDFECRGSNTTIDWASTRFVIEALKSFSATLPVFINFFDFIFRAVTDSESRSNVSSDVRSWERVAICFLNGCFYSFLVFWKSAWKSYSKKWLSY